MYLPPLRPLLIMEPVFPPPTLRQRLPLPLPPSPPSSLATPFQSNPSSILPIFTKRYSLQDQKVTIGVTVGIVLAVFLAAFIYFLYRYRGSIRIHRRPSQKRGVGFGTSKGSRSVSFSGASKDFTGEDTRGRTPIPSSV